MHQVGFRDKPPSWTIYGLADTYSGLCTAFGVMQALFMRERTGEGQFIDSAMLDNMIALNERMVMLYSITGEEPERGRLQHLYPRGAYECRDGYVALNVPDNLIWRRLCSVVGREDLIDDPLCIDGTQRAANSGFVDSVIEAWLRDKTRSEAEDILNSQGVPVGSVYTAEDLFADPHVAARKALLTIDDPEVGEYRFARSPVMLSAAPEIQADPAPRLGQHTEHVMTDLLGYQASEVERLRQAGVI
jgi:CoA:oxalate CoA-transferase